MLSCPSICFLQYMYMLPCLIVRYLSKSCKKFQALCSLCNHIVKSAHCQSVQCILKMEELFKVRDQTSDKCIMKAWPVNYWMANYRLFIVWASISNTVLPMSWHYVGTLHCFRQRIHTYASVQCTYTVPL